MPSRKWTRLDNGGLCDTFHLAAFAQGIHAKTLGHTNWEIQFRLKALTSEAGSGPSQVTAGLAVPPTYNGIVAPPSRPLRVASLFQAAETQSNLIRTVHQAPDETDGATVTAEGSHYDLVLSSGPSGTDVSGVGTQVDLRVTDQKVQKTTALLFTTENLVADLGPMQAAAYLQDRLSYLVRRREERSMVLGTDTMVGLLNASDGDGDELATTGDQGSDQLATAVVKLAESTFEASKLFPTYAALHPMTWLTLVTETPGAGQQAIFGHAGQSSGQTFYGLRLVLSEAIPDDRLIIGNEMAGTRFIHTGFGLLIESSNGYLDAFGRGILAVKAALRSAVAWERPSAVGVLALAA